MSTWVNSFGPPSQPISVSKFLATSSALPPFNPHSYQQILDSASEDLRAECSLDDVLQPLAQIHSSIQLAAHLRRSHTEAVNSIYQSQHPAHASKKRRRDDPAKEVPLEVLDLKEKLAGTQLKSWPLTREAGIFIHPSKHSDHNALTEIKTAGSTPIVSPQQHVPPDDPSQALIFCTTYHLDDTVKYGGAQLTRLSSHVLLCSQTLGDLYDVIPCTSNEQPPEILDENGELLGYGDGDGAVPPSHGAVICIEDVLYGDGLNEVDYADKVLVTLEKLRPERRSRLSKGSAMQDTTLASLTLRINEPYWLLHQGNCEHFIVIETIRFRHQDDPASNASYPLTTHITPPLLDLCRACSKVAAVWSVVGDVRLGETPCPMCGPCWRAIGQGGEDVIAIPLPKHRVGWY